jgi:hypothetical protein
VVKALFNVVYPDIYSFYGLVGVSGVVLFLEAAVLPPVKNWLNSSSLV